VDGEGAELRGITVEVAKLEVEGIELSGSGKACKTGKSLEVIGEKLKS